MAKAETIKRGNLGKLELRLVKSEGRFFGLVDGKQIVEGDSSDDVWRRLHDDAGRADAKYFGYSGARTRFLHWFAGGFQSSNYLEQERSYKLEAKRKLDRLDPNDAATGCGHAQLILAAYQTNLLSPFEKMRVREALLGPRADEFIRAAARFTLEGGKSALLEMERALKPYDAAKWTIVSYLPFLWRPDVHMYLKPEATKDYATRVGHRFAREYETTLELDVYASLLDLAEKTAVELADLSPRDRIDVQSFVWVVGDYRDGREQPQA